MKTQHDIFTVKKEKKVKVKFTAGYTYHFLYKQVMNGVFHKQSASSDAVLSLVKEHWAHALKHTDNNIVDAQLFTLFWKKKQKHKNLP